MKLITEFNDVDVGYQVVESTDPSGAPKKEYYIEGIFGQAETKNRNGRIYPKKTLEAAVQKFVAERVATGRAVGELNHPPVPTINYKEASHRITELYWDGNNLMGKALILDTPNGKLVKSLLDGGVKIGVSTRGMGTVANRNGTNMVNEDFVLNTVDIVEDPSAPSAFVNGILEGVDWVQKDEGLYEQHQGDETETEIEESTGFDADAQIKEFKDFLSGF